MRTNPVLMPAGHLTTGLYERARETSNRSYRSLRSRVIDHSRNGNFVITGFNKPLNQQLDATHAGLHDVDRRPRRTLAKGAEPFCPLWTARVLVVSTPAQTRPGCRCQSSDTCVPISRLAESINDSVDEAEASGIPYWIVGHVGDGNFHLSYLMDPNDSTEVAAVEQLNVQMVQRALRLGGTCSGEHGIGLHKMGYLVEEAGAGAVDMMRSIKRALDPKNIMNPGKVFTV